MENIQISASDTATSYTLPMHHDIRLLHAFTSTCGIYQQEPVAATNQ